MLYLLFHTSVVVFNVFSLWYDQTYVDLPSVVKVGAKMPFKGRGMYLTQWCFMLQTIYFAVAIVNDLLGSNKIAQRNSPTIIKKIQDTLFIIAFPLAVYVASSFWAIYAYERELIFPKAFDAFFPAWLNQSMHTFVLVFILLELLTSYRKYPSRVFGITLITAFNFTYIWWVYNIYFTHKHWVYPILAVLDSYARITFFFFSTLYSISLYVVGEKLNNVIWSKQLKEKAKSHKKK